MGVLICDFICFGGTEFSASEIDVIWNSSCRPSVRKSPRPAWPNTSGSQPAVAKSMPWVPSAAPSQPCAKANGGHKRRDVKGSFPGVSSLSESRVNHQLSAWIISKQFQTDVFCFGFLSRIVHNPSLLIHPKLRRSLHRRSLPCWRS